MRVREVLLVVLGGAACAGLGFLGGRCAGDGDDVGAATPTPEALPSHVTTRAAKALPRLASKAPESVGAPRNLDPQAEAEGQAEVAEDVGDVDLDTALAAARALRDGPPDAHVHEAALLAADALHGRLADDPLALAQALERFRRLRDPEELGFLAAILGRIADPEVEAFAMEVAQRDSDPARRIAALEVLEALESPRARRLALGIVAGEADPGLRRAAVRAIPDVRGSSLEDARAVRSALGRALTQDPDPELRRRASIVLASHARNASELGPVLDTLANDADSNVRAGAAFALEVSGVRDPAVLSALVAVLDREREDPLVQDNAWSALGRLAPLPEDALRAYMSYGERHGEDAHAVD